MKVAVLGTGMVGRSLSEKLIKLGHEVSLGTRDVKTSLAVSDIDSLGNSPLKQWLSELPSINLNFFSAAAKNAEVIFLAAHGCVAKDILDSVSEENIAGKTIIDVSNSLIFGEQGELPRLEIGNTESVGETLQKLFPTAHIVKALNNIQHSLMVNPGSIPGNHNVFISGNNENAKNETKRLLNEFGWKENQIVDLGNIVYARAMEMNVILWWRIYELLGTGDFNFEIRQAK
ncbi:NAD(P)-binding domain-containing protein [Aestuariirhabdus sp. Z084]|uniref:NADPH-dependent F420 reductase n=1 Tax=Aestuariirhabdus haliotis TaxID=2918751 RepID=UPI00201B3B35|nr:NAD(P)-binding domain-containing protein [Aestuariirhabdus haliotis]MCL6417368.1 NAD(P)-binding domain-containing protein [Aestuariirhabdus haliotis]MCL6421313.1 NAD(P)-binding domain-containing protein [Aestuariirhabdus haliotis]